MATFTRWPRQGPIAAVPCNATLTVPSFFPSVLLRSALQDKVFYVFTPVHFASEMDVALASSQLTIRGPVPEPSVQPVLPWLLQKVKEGVDSVDCCKGFLFQVPETLPEEVLQRMHGEHWEPASGNPRSMVRLHFPCKPLLALTQITSAWPSFIRPALS
jgi:hypothetical protein